MEENLYQLILLVNVAISSVSQIIIINSGSKFLILGNYIYVVLNRHVNFINNPLVIIDFWLCVPQVA